MNTLYKDKQWLYNKYCKEKLSTRDMGKMANVGQTTIRKWLHRQEISVRTCGEGTHIKKVNHFIVNKKFEDWISGELLGDGCLFSSSGYSAYILYASKYLEYIDYISGTLEAFGIKQAGHIYKRKTTYGSLGYHYHSRMYEELKPFHTKWYPHGKKIIPSDLELTPVTLRQLYIGDGSLEKPPKRNPKIRLATCCFTDNETDFLINLFKDIGIIATKDNRNYLRISTKSVKQFLDYIGECPVSCYKYKWDISSQN
jgi:hypothetical protein